MIHALPGLGGDRRMYPGAWHDLPGFVAHDWPSQGNAKTLTDVAARVAGEYGIKDGDVVVGASLGGMVACEVAKIRRLQALFLVGSATSKDEISRLLAALHPLAQIAPIDWMRLSAAKIPTDLAQMFAGIEAGFVRTMCAAIFEWEGLGATAVPHYRIHGRGDLVIPFPAKVDLLLDGGHLISMTHARECAEFVRANHQVQGNPVRGERHA